MSMCFQSRKSMSEGQLPPRGLCGWREAWDCVLCSQNAAAARRDGLSQVREGPEPVTGSCPWQKAGWLRQKGSQVRELALKGVTDVPTCPPPAAGVLGEYYRGTSEGKESIVAGLIFLVLFQNNFKFLLKTVTVQEVCLTRNPTGLPKPGS